MDNTAYVPPGSLSVFSNNAPNAGTVTPLQEAIMSRMRPFGLTVREHVEEWMENQLGPLQASDLKDLPPSPFLPGGLGLVRPEGFPNFQVLHFISFRELSYFLVHLKFVIWMGRVAGLMEAW